MNSCLFVSCASSSTFLSHKWLYNCANLSSTQPPRDLYRSKIYTLIKNELRCTKITFPRWPSSELAAMSANTSQMHYSGQASILLPRSQVQKGMFRHFSHDTKAILCLTSAPSSSQYPVGVQVECIDYGKQQPSSMLSRVKMSSSLH